MKYEFEVPGKITGKARPRVNTITAIAYTPAKTKEYEELIKHYFIIQNRCAKPLTGRLIVNIKAYFSIPKNANKMQKEEMLKNNISPVKKPDIDNIAKVILDALNKIAFEDDNQITRLCVEKIYSDEEKINVIIEEY